MQIEQPQQKLVFFSQPHSDPEQFRLMRMQTFDWGTFSGVFTFDISERGYLFVGPSGSGKSTILDAHAALTTPPKWVDFNVAARETERNGKDRNILTYLRGAWAQQTADTGEYVARYLRPDTTWSAIAETYRNGLGQVVVLAQVLWVRGKSTAPGDVKRYYFILERDFDVRELQFLPENDFDVKRFKLNLPDAFVRDEFSAYQERFRRLLGIESERALRLLHKTQSAKNLGDLNTFLRDFMLDPPETFELAGKLVAQFHELNEAHRAVVNARRQIETLKPARDEDAAHAAARRDKNVLDELSVGVDKYKEQLRKKFLENAIAESNTELEGMQQEAQRLEGLTQNEFLKLRSLQDQRSGMGGNLLERLTLDLEAAEKQRESALRKRDVAAAACTTMGWTTPDSAVWFTQRREAAVQYLLQEKTRREELGQRKFLLQSTLAEKSESFRQARIEIEALTRRRSNIPANMLEVREAMAQALGLEEERLPFAGELLQVKEEDVAWQGAIERVLGGFALSLVVDDRYYAKVAAYLNETHTGQLVRYFRVVNRPASNQSIKTNSLVHKVSVADGPFNAWMREELKAHFDYECCETVETFRAATKALTKEGQVKHSATRHEKNDSYSVQDRRRWYLGFDNSAKIALYQQQAVELAAEIEGLNREIRGLDEDADMQHKKAMACNNLANTTWEEVDVSSAIARVNALGEQIKTEQAARPDLAKLDVAIQTQEQVHQKAVKAETTYAAKIATERKHLEGLERRYAALHPELLSVALTPHQHKGLEERFRLAAKELTLETLDNVTTQVVRSINSEERELSDRILQLQNSIERRFEEFIRLWPAEAGGLDAKIASAPDFFGKLHRLETDGLPKYEGRFFELLKEQSNQNLTRLSTQLDYERKAIRDRMNLVNESLTGAPFGQGTSLVIDIQDKMLEDVTAFKQSLKASLSHALNSDAEAAEKRFEAISTLVKRFASQDSADLKWRSLVLDVRQHVEFVAREIDQSGVEVEVYRSGAGKSGGQRQKLAATCLAAALRYQLGGQDRALPQFSTVFLDEAFDKADAEFTATAMNIFKTFGFQMIVATPLKSVMTLEPFIGGACFVHIKDRKTSAVIPIDYDLQAQRLKLTSEVNTHAKAATA